MLLTHSKTVIIEDLSRRANYARSSYFYCGLKDVQLKRKKFCFKQAPYLLLSIMSVMVSAFRDKYTSRD